MKIPIQNVVWTQKSGAGITVTCPTQAFNQIGEEICHERQVMCFASFNNWSQDTVTPSWGDPYPTNPPFRNMLSPSVSGQFNWNATEGRWMLGLETLQGGSHAHQACLPWSPLIHTRIRRQWPPDHTPRGSMESISLSCLAQLQLLFTPRLQDPGLCSVTLHSCLSSLGGLQSPSIWTAADPVLFCLIAGDIFPSHPVELYAPR